MQNHIQISQELVGEAREFGEWASQLMAPYVSVISSKPAPTSLYQYTNDIGLKGVLESGHLWVSNIFNLNDPSEVQYGFYVAFEYLKTKCISGPAIAKNFVQEIEFFLQRGGVQKSAHYLACCFSPDGDDLSQWRAYGDNGRGFALGFHGQALEEAFTKPQGVQIPNNSTFPISYDEGTLSSLQKSLVDRLYLTLSKPVASQAMGFAKKFFLRNVAETFALHSLEASIFFKHKAYRHEDEYRFLEIHRADQPIPEAKQRARHNALIQYREFDWRALSPGALFEIVVGPAADRAKAERFVNDCVEAFKIDKIPIRFSTIPYRPI